MLSWLEADLANTLQPWIIAFWHHPPYSRGSHDSDFEIELLEMRENALPLLEAGGVDLVLCGHSHA
jgi:3',5'-cyclic AMP phosphodiesterase CpdA